MDHEERICPWLIDDYLLLYIVFLLYLSVSKFPPLRRTPILIELGPTLMTTSYRNYLSKGPVSKYGHILRYKDKNFNIGIFLEGDTIQLITGDKRVEQFSIWTLKSSRMIAGDGAKKASPLICLSSDPKYGHSPKFSLCSSTVSLSPFLE